VEPTLGVVFKIKDAAMDCTDVATSGEFMLFPFQGQKYRCGA
jgi:hypothetical protein